MGKLKTLMIGSGAFLLAFAWKLLIFILVSILLFYSSRKLIDHLYNKSLNEKWD